MEKILLCIIIAFMFSPILHVTQVTLEAAFNLEEQ